MKYYNGDLNKLNLEAKDSADLEEKLKLGKGIGEVTVAIFLKRYLIKLVYCYEWILNWRITLDQQP